MNGIGGNRPVVPSSIQNTQDTSQTSQADKMKAMEGRWNARIGGQSREVKPLDTPPAGFKEEAGTTAQSPTSTPEQKTEFKSADLYTPDGARKNTGNENIVDQSSPSPLREGAQKENLHLRNDSENKAKESATTNTVKDVEIPTSELTPQAIEAKIEPVSTPEVQKATVEELPQPKTPEMYTLEGQRTSEGGEDSIERGPRNLRSESEHRDNYWLREKSSGQEKTEPPRLTRQSSDSGDNVSSLRSKFEVPSMPKPEVKPEPMPAMPKPEVKPEPMPAMPKLEPKPIEAIKVKLEMPALQEAKIEELPKPQRAEVMMYDAEGRQQVDEGYSNEMNADEIMDRLEQKEAGGESAPKNIRASSIRDNYFLKQDRKEKEETEPPKITRDISSLFAKKPSAHESALAALQETKPQEAVVEEAVVEEAVIEEAVIEEAVIEEPSISGDDVMDGLPTAGMDVVESAPLQEAEIPVQPMEAPLSPPRPLPVVPAPMPMPVAEAPAMTASSSSSNNNNVFNPTVNITIPGLDSIANALKGIGGAGTPAPQEAAPAKPAEEAKPAEDPALKELEDKAKAEHPEKAKELDKAKDEIYYTDVWRYVMNAGMAIVNRGEVSIDQLLQFLNEAINEKRDADKEHVSSATGNIHAESTSAKNVVDGEEEGTTSFDQFKANFRKQLSESRSADSTNKEDNTPSIRYKPNNRTNRGSRRNTGNK